MAKQGLLLTILFLIAVPAFSQARGGPTSIGVFSIQGRLLFPPNAAPNQRVEIALDSAPGGAGIHKNTAMNAGSDFLFSGLIPGDYTISIRLPDYAEISRNVAVAQTTRVVNVDIEMRPLLGTVRNENTDAAPEVVDVRLLDHTYPKKALQSYEKAMAQMKKGNAANAVTPFVEALALAPEFYSAEYNLGLAYARLGRFNDGEEAFRRAAEMNTRTPLPPLNLGMLLIDEAEARRAEGPQISSALLQSAMESLNRALTLRPALASAHFYLGSALYKSGQYAEAETALLKAHELDPSLGQARIMLANVYVKVRRLPDALTQVEAYLKENPKSGERQAMETLRSQLSSAIKRPF